MNLPNKLTLARILLVPVFMLCASRAFDPAWMLAAAIVFTAASLTDLLDGWLARRWNMVTDFGKFADPLADKLLTTTAFLYMMADGACSPVVLVVILAREFAVSGVRMLAAAQDRVVAANLWGKAKTVLQMLTIILYYFGVAYEAWQRGFGGSAYLSQVLGYALCWLVAAVTLISGTVYLWQNRDCFIKAK